MSQQSVNGIRAACAITEPWLVSATAEAFRHPYWRNAPWISADEAMQLMETSPDAAEARARDVLRANAHDPQAECLLAAAFMRREQWSKARAVLEPLSEMQPQME